MEQAVKS